uniref:Uncharacterized protein n=1 Tax=Vitis vinifera TaxID=29760 RepID=F6GY35_VITVI
MNLGYTGKIFSKTTLSYLYRLCP